MYEKFYVHENKIKYTKLPPQICQKFTSWKRKEDLSTNQPQFKSWLNNKIKLSYTILDKVMQLILSLTFLHSFTLLHTFCEKLKLSVEVCFLHSRIFINSFVCIRCAFIMWKQNYGATSTFLNNTYTYVKVLIQRFDSN